MRIQEDIIHVSGLFIHIVDLQRLQETAAQEGEGTQQASSQHVETNQQNCVIGHPQRNRSLMYTQKNDRLFIWLGTMSSTV